MRLRRGEYTPDSPGNNTDMDERRYRTMEAASNRLQKEAKGYLDSLRGESPASPSTWGVTDIPGQP
jgi:hypothetical protein